MIELKVLKRDKKENNKYLRSQGLIPAVMYGPGFESISISIYDNEFRKVYREAGTSNVIYTAGELKDEMVIVQDMNIDVVSGDILSVDFKVVNKGESTEVTIPIKLVGESPVVKNNIGLINFLHEEVVIKTIPSLIPNHLDVDISKLSDIGDSIKLSDIDLREGVELVDDDSITVVSVVSLQKDKEPEEMENNYPEPEVINDKEEE